MSKKLLIYYLEILKQSNYKEIIEGLDVYQLLHISPSASKEEVMAAYQYLKMKFLPNCIPERHAFRERLEFLLNKIDRCYENIMSVIENNRENRFFEFSLISEGRKDEGVVTNSFDLPNKEICEDFISEGNASVDSSTRINHENCSGFSLISEGPSVSTAITLDLNTQRAFIEMLSNADFHNSDEIFTLGSCDQKRNK